MFEEKTLSLVILLHLEGQLRVSLCVVIIRESKTMTFAKTMCGNCYYVAADI